MLRTALDLFVSREPLLSKLLQDVPETRWAEQPAGLPNHAAWTMGHLCLAHNVLLSLLGDKPRCPAEWKQHMDMGTQPVSDRNLYPTCEALWTAYREGQAAVTAAVRAADPEMMSQTMPIESFRVFFPTIGHATLYLLCTHEATHHGQLQTWKRALH
ncbi:DinB family protein [Mucisphaera sp.]|uniref:DinB family protein n=1 Tax=Mucisphaera sp. TaxID=2913024 RepID=UPI003D0B74BE